MGEYEQETFKALAIDGGGIKGLYSALLLAHLEEEYGGSIADHFDLLCGTSTGGLIALGLSLKIPARDLAQFYVDKKDTIFPQAGKWRSVFRQIVRGGKYKQDGLRAALYDVFGDRTLADSETLLCIPAFDLTGDRPWIFKHDHGGLAGRDNGTRYVDVALATSAAPTYFPVAEIPNHAGHRFIDGGVYANNPSAIALTEALTYFVGPGCACDRVALLSVPSLEVAAGQTPGRKNDLSALEWRADLLGPFGTGHSHITHFMLTQFAKHDLLPVDYHRMRQPSKLSGAQAALVGLDKASDAAVQQLWAFGDDAGLAQRREPEVAAFFRSRKANPLR